MSSRLILTLIFGIVLLSCSKNQEPYQKVSFSQELLKKAEVGDSKAQLQLAGCYSEGRGIEKDLRLAFEWANKSANQNYPLAQAILGQIYHFGEGVDKNDTKAFEWFQKAAENGCSVGQYNLACAYFSGRGTKANDKEAFRWMKKASEDSKGEAYGIANYRLAQMYLNEWGVKKEFNKGFEYAKKAANSGSAEANYLVGDLYHSGKGCDKNYDQATKYYLIAADKKYEPAFCALGNCDLKEQHSGTKRENAFRWFQKAAEAGCAYGTYSLGYCYENGIGVPKNINTSKKLYLEAAKKGWEEARIRLMLLQEVK